MSTVMIFTFMLEAFRIYLYMHGMRVCIGGYKCSKRVMAVVFCILWLFETGLSCLFPESRRFMIAVTDFFYFLMEVPFLLLVSFCYKGGMGQRLLMSVFLPLFYWGGKWILAAVFFSDLQIDDRRYFIVTSAALFFFFLLEIGWEKIGKSKQELERELLMQEIRAYENQFQIIHESQHIIRALRHDMKHHMKMLTDLVSEGENEEALTYLSSMGAFMENGEEYVASGNERIDGILNYMISKAKRCGIAVDWKIQIPEQLKVDVFDLNVILGNLFDNAFHALMEVQEPKLYIRMRYDRGVLCIDVENSVGDDVGEIDGKHAGGGKGYAGSRVENGVFMADECLKSEEVHGFGLKNVRKVVEKYHGSVDIACRDGMFTVNILLFLEETPVEG